MPLTTETIVAIVVAAVAPVVGWVGRVENKFYRQDVAVTEAKSDLESTKAITDERFDHIAETLQRIENTLYWRLERIEKSMNGHLVRE